ncbi:Acetyl-/propionyl-coenzyme A carboxylase alpha chain [bioreactor metagenome]|uniref:Acetyl-/propionyl-coenzyme A carboxylase alpha chain n=1 Tax=bioreactor metagenome TaxID=1076179 RepID=A0A645CRY7_9ZZZZ
MEFLLDTNGQFYFMEMNTRLQVEHAVTEAVTGVDLVAWQLRIAAGEHLSLQQRDIRLDGHAMEARLTAEDVVAGFLPQTGKVLFWQAPDAPVASPLTAHLKPLEVRVEHALCSGSSIGPHYDSMIAKVVTHGATRHEARRKLVTALQNCILLGVSTNQQFLVECLQSPQFVDGKEVHSGFVERYMGHYFKHPPTASPRTIAFAALALVLDKLAGPGGHLQRAPTPLELLVGEHHWHAQVQANDIGWRVTLGSAEHSAEQAFQMRDLHWLDESHQHFQVECDGIAEKAVAVRNARQLELFHAGQAWHFEQLDAYKSCTADQGTGVITAPLTGRVALVAVELGESVCQGQTIAVLEAMKMEHTLTAPISGRVVELHTRPDTQTTKGTLLLRIEEHAE